MNETLVVEIVMGTGALGLKFIKDGTEVNKNGPGGVIDLTGIALLSWRCALGDFKIFEVDPTTNQRIRLVHEHTSLAPATDADDPTTSATGTLLEDGAAEYEIVVVGIALSATGRFGRKLKVS